MFERAFEGFDDRVAKDVQHRGQDRGLGRIETPVHRHPGTETIGRVIADQMREAADDRLLDEADRVIPESCFGLKMLRCSKTGPT